MGIDHTKNLRIWFVVSVKVKETNLYRIGKIRLLQHVSQGKDGISSDFCSFPFAICLNQNIFYITPIKCSSLYFELILKYLATYGLFEVGKSRIRIWANLRMTTAS